MVYNEKNIEKYIKLLNLPNSFDVQILKIQYRKNVLKYHPDLAQRATDKRQFEFRMKEINEAYEQLKELLNKNNGKYCLNKKNQVHQETTRNSENVEKTEEEEILTKDDFWFNYFFDNFEEYHKHVYNDTEQDFKEYIENLCKKLNIKGKSKKNFREDNIKYFKEEKLNLKINLIGGLLGFLGIICILLYVFFLEEIFINIVKVTCIPCLCIWFYNMKKQYK